MPKVKTKSGAKKRFKRTATGKIKRKRGYHRHILEHQTSKQGRRLKKKTLVSKGDLPSVRRMLVVGLH